MPVKRKSFRSCTAAVVFALLFSFLTALPVLAEEDACVYASIADGDGKTVLAFQEVLLQDADGDGALTVHDALLAAHDARFDGGAAAGFSSEQTENGRIATMLWGQQDCCFGIYVNHLPVDDLLAPLQDGDALYAFACGDPSEVQYCHFDVSRASVGGEETLTLTLTGLAPDGEEQPVADAVIRIDGKDTAFRTDGDGKVTLQFDGSGSCVVSARKDGVALVPPVCAVSVSEEQPFAGDRFAPLRWVLLSVGALAGIVLALRWRIRRTNPL
ncbi:MAG: hypothetical protein J1E00_05900 [Oscillospiraceae bacterium]|nr:hypothetical protein [Oscillospiraceae bacterium]